MVHADGVFPILTNARCTYNGSSIEWLIIRNSSHMEALVATVWNVCPVVRKFPYLYRHQSICEPATVAKWNRDCIQSHVFLFQVQIFEVSNVWFYCNARQWWRGNTSPYPSFDCSDVYYLVFGVFSSFTRTLCLYEARGLHGCGPPKTTLLLQEHRDHWD